MNLVSEATVAQWLKKEGEAVQADEPIVELETDKVTLEVNAPADGVIAKITVGEGESVEVGAILGEMGEGGAAANDTSVPAPAAEAPAAPAAPEPVMPTASAPAPAPIVAPADEPKLSPAVRKMIADNHLDASSIPASGPHGRVTKEDVQNFYQRYAALRLPQLLLMPQWRLRLLLQLRRRVRPVRERSA